MAKGEYVDDNATKSWCARHPKCRCCSICGGITLLLLIILAIIFWPRLILLCVDYTNSGLSASVTQQALTASSPVEVRMNIPIKTKSHNLWSLHVPKVRVEAFYKNNYNAHLGAGEIKDLRLNALSESSFTVDVIPPQATASQVATATQLYDINNGECRASACVGAACTWPVDLKIMITILGYEIAFWVRDLAMPCPRVAAGASLVPLAVQDDGQSCASKEEAYKTEHNCVAFFCSVSDIMCKGEDCMKNQEGKTPEGQASTSR